jgi:hypothetical protein
MPFTTIFSNAKYFYRQSPFVLLGRLILKARTANAGSLLFPMKKHRYWNIIPNHEPVKLNKNTNNSNIALI